MENKLEEKKEIEEEKKQEENRKEKAIARGKDIGMSKKHAMAICKFIKGRKIEEAIDLLEKVMSKKIALPMKGELPHRKGMERGRYPVNASKIFIRLLKSLMANCNVNNINNPYITFAKADKASRPHRRFKGRFKRTNVYLEASELQESKISDTREKEEKNE